jgi:hypothetical protein
MIDNNSFSHEGQGQFVISFELLCLLKWLIENDAPKLKKMISKAISSGFKPSLYSNNNLSREDIEEIHFNIIEFLGLLEALLHESLHEETTKQAVEKKLMPAIDHIDSTICDDEMVRSSIQKATAKSEIHPELSPEDLLFEELLRQWKPAKDSVKN